MRKIIILLLSLLSFIGIYPILKAQNTQNGVQENVKTTYKKITIIEDEFPPEKKKIVQNYIDQITKWSESQNAQNMSQIPPIPENLKNVDVSINNIQVNDTQKITIKISDIQIQENTNFRYKPNKIAPSIQGDDSAVTNSNEMPSMEPAMRNNPPPPRHGANRREKLRMRRMLANKHKIDKVVSQSRFNLGLLDVVGNKPVMPTVMPNRDMPDLDAGKTLQIGFDHSWGINLLRGKVRFWIGVNYDIQNYRFENNQVRLLPNDPRFGWDVENTQANPNRIADKSKLVSNYLGIPISIGFQNKKRNPTFSMKVGVQASALVRSHSKVRFLNGDKEKFFTDFGLNNYAISPFAILQFKHLGIFAKYGLTDVFKKSPERQGISNHNLAVGFTLSTNIN